MLSVMKIYFPASLAVWGWSCDSSGQWEISRNKRHWMGLFGKTFKQGWLSWWNSLLPLLFPLSCLKCKQDGWRSSSIYRTWSGRAEIQKELESLIHGGTPILALGSLPLYYLSRDRKTPHFPLGLTIVIGFSVFSFDLITAPNQRPSLDIHILHNGTLIHRFIEPLSYWVPHTLVHRPAMGWLLM